jgi:L-serine/L-threonine ammonia-lyase
LHFYSSSGGNAGLACVAAATKLGYKSAVVVPLTTKPMMIEKIHTAGATKVIQHGVTWKEADKHLREAILAMDETGVYIPPFDHEDIWTGNATMVTEIEQQLGGQPDVIVCSVGGGGLFCGIMQGLGFHPSHSTRVIAVETHGADSLHQAVQAGQLITLPGITSIATSLGATQVCAQALHYGLKSNVKTVVVTDQEAIDGCIRLVNDERLLVEPACGASVIMGYGKLREIIPDLSPESRVVIVVCGGSNVTVEMISEWSAQYGVVTQ